MKVNKTDIFVSIKGSCFSDFYKKTHHNSVEFRLDDYICSTEDLNKLLSLYNRTIITVKSGSISDDERLGIYRDSIDAGVDYIDLDFSSDMFIFEQLYDRLIESKTKLIVSFHEIKKTPGTGFLYEIYNQIDALSPDLIKIVCKANSYNDNANIMNLYNYSGSKKLVAFCNGNYGRISRIASILAGAPLSYACSDLSSITSEGQMTIEEISDVLEIIS